MVDTCDNCKFSHLAGQSRICQRFPPQWQIVGLAPKVIGVPAQMAKQIDFATCPPAPLNWCGEHKLKVEQSDG